jgi:hypothetical protein
MDPENTLHAGCCADVQPLQEGSPDFSLRERKKGKEWEGAMSADVVD